MSKAIVLFIVILGMNLSANDIYGKGKGDKKLVITPLSFYSDPYANSDKYLIDLGAFGLGYEYGLLDNTSILLPIQLSYQSQFIYLAPTLKFYKKKKNQINSSFDIALVYNHGRQEVCHHIRSNYYRVIDIKRNRIGAFIGFSANPKLSDKFSLHFHGSLGSYFIDNAKSYHGESCGEFYLIDLVPRTRLGISIAYNLNHTNSKKNK